MANEWGGVGCEHPIAEQETIVEGGWLVTVCLKCSVEIKRVKA